MRRQFPSVAKAAIRNTNAANMLSIFGIFVHDGCRETYFLNFPVSGLPSQMKRHPIRSLDHHLPSFGSAGCSAIPESFSAVLCDELRGIIDHVTSLPCRTHARTQIRERNAFIYFPFELTSNATPRALYISPQIHTPENPMYSPGAHVSARETRAEKLIPTGRASSHTTQKKKKKER